MDPAQLTSLIQASNILTDAERTYWLASVPRMTPEQQQKLEAILAKAAKIPWTEQIQNYFTLIAKSAGNIASQAA